jgi:hypothetical protein
MGVCIVCAGTSRPVSPERYCHNEDNDGTRIVGTGCYEVIEAADRVKLDGLATAMGCRRDQVNPDTLAAAADVLPSEWHKVDVEAINTKRDLVRAAVAERIAKGKP